MVSRDELMNNISDEFLFGEKIDMAKFKETLLKDGNDDELHSFFQHKAGKIKKTKTLYNDKPCVISKQKPPQDPLAANLHYYQKTNP